MANSRRLTVLAINYPPEPNGNAPYSGALATGLARAGHRVTAHVTHPHYPAWSISEGYGQWSRVEVIDGVRVRRMRHYVPNPPRSVRRLASEISFGLRLLAAPKTDPEVVIALSPALFSTWIASWRLGGRPLVVWVQDIYSLGLSEIGEGGGLAAKVTHAVEGRTLRRASRIVVIHDRFKRRLIELYNIDPSRITVMRNWTYIAPAEIGDVAKAREERGWDSDEIVVLYTGNFGAKQGLENVIEAARQAAGVDRKVRFVLMGGGGDEDRLRKLAGVSVGSGEPAVSMDGRLEFHGPLPAQQFRRALAAADILLVSEKPGVSESSVPSKLATYFDAGRAVIAAGDPEGITAAELEAADAGVFVPAGEPRRLLDAVLSLAADGARAAKLGQNGRRFRETEMDQGIALKRWDELVDEVSREGARRAR